MDFTIRKTFILIPIVFFDYMSARITGYDLEGLFGQIDIDYNFYAILLWVLHFSIMSFLFFSYIEKYLHGFGLLELVRTQSRHLLIRKVLEGVVIVVPIAEAVICLIYVLMVLLYNELTVSILNLQHILVEYFYTCWTFILFVFLQQIISLVVSSRLATLVVQSLFLIVLVIKPMIENFLYEKPFMLSEIGLMFISALLLIAGIVLLYVIGIKIIDRDIL